MTSVETSVVYERISKNISFFPFHFEAYLCVKLKIQEYYLILFLVMWVIYFSRLSENIATSEQLY